MLLDTSNIGLQLVLTGLDSLWDKLKWDLNFLLKSVI